MRKSRPDGLMSIPEVARYIGKHPQQVREYLANGMLAEPAHSIASGKLGLRKIRLFTLQEAERMKHDFDTARYGTFSERKRRRKKQ